MPFTSLTTDSSTANQTTPYTTASVTPTANQPVLLGLLTSVGSGTTPTPVITGCNLTWTLLANPVAASRTTWVFLGIGSSPTAGAISIAGDGTSTLTSALWNVVQASGVDTSVSNGVVQSVGNKTASVTSVSLAFPSTVTSTNMAYAVIGTSVSEAPTPGTGWTSVGSGTQTAPTSGLVAQAAATAPPQNITGSWTTSATGMMAGVELAASSGSGPDTTAPTVPGSVTATAITANKVTVAWTASTDAVGVATYRIQRGGVDLTGATALSNGVLSFDDTTVVPSTAYSYTVSAIDAAGNRSAESTPATVTTPGGASLTGPISLVGTRGAFGTGNGTVAHLNPTGTASGDFLVTQVHNDVTTNTINTPTGWTLQSGPVPDPQLTDGNHYVFTRFADGTSADTPTWTSTVGTDFLAYEVVALRGVSHVGTINQIASTSGTGSPTTAISMTTTVDNCFVINFIADRKNAADTPPRFTPQNTADWVDDLDMGVGTGAVSLSIHDTALVKATAGAVPTQTYHQTSSSNGYVNFQVAVAPALPDTTAPTVPSGVTATATSSTSVTVSWTASTDAGGVASYRVRRGGVDVTGGTAVTGTSFVDNTVSASTSYSYTVSAVDWAGNRSAESSAANVTTPAVALAPTVGAGTDASVAVNSTFSRTATESDGGASITSRAWTIQSGPAGVGTTIGTVAALSWVPTTAGTYTLRYSATNSVGTGTDDVVVTVTGASVAGRWVGGVGTSGATVSVKTASATSVRLKVATNSALTTGVVFSSSVTPDAQSMSKLSVTGLTANTTYYYALELNGTMDGAVRTFKTFPTGQASFSFAFGSCTNDVDSEVFGRIKARNPLLFVNLGDLRYINPGSNNTTLFTNMYDQVLTAPFEGDLYANVPTAYTWSDHDATGSNGDGTAAALPAAQSVYRQYVPSYALPAADTKGIYQTWVVGRVRFIMTDNRSYKTPDGATDNSSKTMLGTVQKQWFKDTLTAATEPLIVWAQENLWNDADPADNDNWAGFTTERTELASFITASGKNVIALSGDTHQMAADDGTNTAGHIPQLLCAPFANTTAAKGGPWSQGSHKETGSNVGRYYATVDVTDTGSTIAFSFKAYDNTDTPQITLAKTYTLTPVTGDLRLGATASTAAYLGTSTVSKFYLGANAI